MKFNIITIFPEIFNSYFRESIIKRAQEKKIINIKTHNLRDYTEDKHKTVYDTPYGGGAGMVIKIKPLYKDIQVLKSKMKNQKSKIILLSAKGKQWDQQMAKKYSNLDNLILICGRYEGVDERIKYFIDEEISIGDYVLTGGEIPAMVLIDSITRLIPKVLGNQESIISESHAKKGVLEYPQYTRPRVFLAKGKEYKVANVLLSGNHQEIEKWRKNNQKNK